MLCGELRGAFLDELLQVALIVAVFDDKTAVLQRASNAQKELVLDVTAAKRFSLTEFQAQFLNVLNHPQFTPGFANRVDSIGFTGSAPTNYLTPSNAVFNQPERAFPSNSRTLQLALKFIF